MYLLKTKGTAKIPDYIQIRDDDFILIDHFRADNHEKVSAFTIAMADKSACASTCAKVSRPSPTFPDLRYGTGGTGQAVRDRSVDKFSELINKLPYGILRKIE